MVKEFVQAWDKNKDRLEEYIRTHKQEEYASYKDLVKLVFDLVINPEIVESVWGPAKFRTDSMRVLDDGDYQGTLLFILYRDTYQPNPEDYAATNVYYGSCSGCDTLQGIHCYATDELPSDRQVEEYMTLCLHILQQCTYIFKGDEE